MNIKWLPNISLLNYKKKNGKQKFVRSRKRFRTITWKYTKTIGPFASFIYIFNQSIGSGLFDIPSLIDEVGWIPVIFGNLFVCSVAVFCSLMILRAMTMIPKNKNFEQRIEYSAVIKYFMSNKKYKFVSFLYHLGNLCNNICGILVISKIVDIFIIKLFGSTILFQVYPQIKVSKCSLSLLDTMYNGYYYSSTGHYETVVIGGVTIGYIINAIICIHLSSKGLEETINYQYVVFMIFMTSFLYLSVSSTIYLLSQNYVDQNGTLSKVDVHNNLILNRAHLETDLVKNYLKYKDINHVKKNPQLCRADPFFDRCPVKDQFGRNPFSVESGENERVVRSSHVWGNLQREVQREVQRGSLHRRGKTFSCSCLSLNPLYQKKAYIFRNSIFYFTVSSCSYGMNAKKAASLRHFYSVYKIYHSLERSGGGVASWNGAEWRHSKGEERKGADRQRERRKTDEQNNREGGKFSGARYPNGGEEAQKQNKMFFTNLYHMISRIEGIKSYCMGKTFANFIDSYGFVSNIPSWGNEITDDVNVSKAIWLTVILSSIFYFIFGLIFCLNNSFQNINTSVLYLFNFVAVAPKVITGSISMRYDLMNLDICSDNAAFFFGCIAPFLSAWIFSNGIIFSDAFNYTSLICGLFCNFLSPAFAYISACESNKSFYKNPLRKYTIVNRKKTVFSSSSDIRRALGNIIDTFDDEEGEKHAVEDSDERDKKWRGGDNYQLRGRGEEQEEDAELEAEFEAGLDAGAALGYRRSLSLNRYASQRESKFSSISRSSYFKFVSGECLPKSYSKGSTGQDSLSERNSSDFKFANNYDGSGGVHTHGDTAEEQPFRIKGDGTSSSALLGKNGKKKKKKGVMFSDEIEECSSRENFKSKRGCSYGEIGGEEEATLGSDRCTKGSHSNDRDICGETEEMPFLKQSRRTNQRDDTWGSRNSSHEILEDVKMQEVKKEKKVKKKLMFSDEVQLCSEVDEAAEGKRKNSKGVTFAEESKEPAVEDAKHAKREKKAMSVSLNVQLCSEDVDATKKKNSQFGITVNDEAVPEKRGEQRGSLNPASDPENVAPNGNSEGQKTSLFECERGEETESVEPQKGEPEPSAPSTSQNEQQTGQISKKGSADLHDQEVDNPVVKSVNQACPAEVSPHYKINTISNNECVASGGEKAKRCAKDSGEDCEIDPGDQNGTAANHSENEHTPGAEKAKLGEKEEEEKKKKGGNLLCVRFEEHTQEETAATLPENITAKIKNVMQYERNFSDSAINYDARNQMKKLEMKGNEVIRKNRSFEQPEQVFKRQREKLKSHYKCSISNVLGSFANYDDIIIQGMEHLERKEINGENLLKSTSNGFEEENELGPPNGNSSRVGSTNDKSFVEDTLVEEADETLNKENTFSSFEKDDADVIPNVLVHKTCERDGDIGKGRDGSKREPFSEHIQQVQATETGSFDHAAMGGRTYSIHLRKENSKDDEILINNLKDLSTEQGLNKNSLQPGQSLHVSQMGNPTGGHSQKFPFDDAFISKHSNNREANMNMCKINLLINNTSYRDERDALLKHSKSDALAGEKHHKMSALSTEQGENTHNEQNSPPLGEHKEDPHLLSFSFRNNFNKQKCASCEIISLPEHATIPQRKMKTLNYQDSVNEMDTANELHKKNTLFVRQRKKLKSSFHANGDMITGNHKEAIHKEQINEFRKQISKESCILNYYDDEKCTDVAQGEACQMGEEKLDQVVTKKKVAENKAELEIPILHIMKSYEGQAASPDVDVAVKDSVEPKSKGDPRRKTCYKFADISKLMSDIDLGEFDSAEGEMVDGGHHTVVDRNEAMQGEDKADHFSTPANDTNLKSDERVNLSEEKDPSAETEKPDVVKKLERIYSALSTKLHSEDPEMCTSDDHDHTDCVDFRCFKIIDNVSPVKYYYNAFHRSKILDSKKYDHIYSNDYMIDDKTNMDHLCSIFLFGNPLERSEECADGNSGGNGNSNSNSNSNSNGDGKKGVGAGDEQTDATSDAQNERLNQDRGESAATFEDQKEDTSSTSGLYEEKGPLIKRSFSGSLESHSEILKRCIFEKSDLSGGSVLSRRKPNIKFSLNEEIINTEVPKKRKRKINHELNDIFRTNDIVGDARKSSDKIEVMKIRIHVYPALLQKYHVETTYLLLGCLTVFSFVGIITDFLFG
ncbi:hypothetical protein, conserved [Plasmodium vivax]|uniref:Amino acid transporter n=1 Tax=Plasmodium vivax (strain Salvador I) TaxID=126793 RepID=A5K8H7_PLAVS|nr:hypothetical protein, conserved [Plasmodium vivax]EDL44123.1 hypothetical protein, conserved [Plasmodium vivax]|eukprot:XP_001613850.1 hypothetical protein [Plasmodium vivax Sal-1]